MSMSETKLKNPDTYKLQKIIFDMGIAFDEICRKHGIRYSLAFGSLIGAVRHKGFIPWDDDLDFLIPRPDFERLLKVAGDELPEFYKIQNFRIDGSKRYVTRMIDTRVMLRFESYETHNDLNPWIDFFVLDGSPEGKLSFKIHAYRILWHKAMCAFASFNETVNLNRPGRPLYQQLIINFCHKTHFGRWMDIYKQLEKYDRALKRYPFEKCETCICGVGTYGIEKQTWPTASFQNLREYEFEDVTFVGPVDYDGVLKVTYGDYMTLPPEDKREPHKIKILDEGNIK